MDSSPLVLVLAALAGGSSLGTIATILANIRKASKAQVAALERKITELTDQLAKCRGDCVDAKAEAASAKVDNRDWQARFDRQAQDWQSQVKRLEDEQARTVAHWQSEADRWHSEADRKAQEATHWRERWMTDIAR